jgi:DNA-directed RNA polymerase subunit RPC12/RpoP
VFVFYLGEHAMKAKTTCPQCHKTVVADVTTDKELHDLTCPHCQHKFKIKPSKKSSSKTEENDCTWEECGEPRKTVLSKLRRHTNRPIIISFLLLTAGVLGLFTAVYLISNDSMIPAELGIITEIFRVLASERVLLSYVVIICSAFAIIGSFTAFFRRYFIVTMFCAIIGIFSIGFVIGIVLAIISLILLILVREEFDHEVTCRTF